MGDLAGLVDLLAPFFGLIGLGFACGRWAPRPEGTAGLAWMQFFLIYVALPALFFRLVSAQPLEEFVQWRFVAATTAATGLTFLAALLVGLRASGGDLAEATVQGVAGAYANVGFMGPPLVLGALGPAASAPVALIFVFDNLLLFALTPLLMAAAGRERGGALAAARGVVARVATHPFNLATAAGLAFGASHAILPGALDRALGWLAGAAAPTALFLLGLSVALRPIRAVPGEVWALAGIKLVVHPLIALGLLTLVGGAFGAVAPVWVYTAVTMAALPPALNLFVISSQYGVGIERAAACVLVGTLGSLVTLTAFLWLIRTGHLPPIPEAGP